METRIYIEGEKYITPEEQKWIDRIEKQSFEQEVVYVSASGERRQFLDYKLPFGAKGKSTKYFPQESPDEPRQYITPQAILDGPCGYVYYFDEAGKHCRCSIEEWFKFLGKKYTQDVLPPAPPQPTVGIGWLETQKMKQKMLDSQAVKAAKEEATAPKKADD